VLALQAGGGAAKGRAMGNFIDECVLAIPAGCRAKSRLWIRVDSAGYQQEVAEPATTLLDRQVRLMVRRQPKWAGEQRVRRAGRLAAARDHRQHVARLSRILAGATDGVGGEVHELAGLLVGGSSAGLVYGHEGVLTLVLLWQQRREEAGAVGAE
jgi:hypothetical protein